MKLKRRILSGLLAVSMLAGGFFINSGQANAEDPVPWVPSPSDEAFAAAAPGDWAFDVTSVPLHNAILVKYPTIDNAPCDGYISISEANTSTVLEIDINSNSNLKGTLNGLEHFKLLENVALWNNGLSGAIPTNIGEATHLKSFNIYGNQLSGLIPSSITNLPNLEKLLLSYNQLSGPIPEDLGNLSKLTQLYLQSNQLTGTIPESINSLTKMVDLNLAINKLTGNLPNLNSLVDMTTFNVSSNQLSGALPDYSALTKVTTFLISGNQFNIYAVSGSDSGLTDSLTQEKINSASADLASFPLNLTSISTWQSSINHAQALLDLRTDAEDQVGTLITTAGDDLNTGITQTEIDDAQTAVDLLPVGSTVKADLQAKIDLAQQMLDTTAQVDALLTPDGANRAASTTQTDIDDAQTAVTALPDGTLKDELQAKIDIAQNLLDAEGLVGDLLVDGKTALATSVTQGAITAAQTAVTALPDGTTKTNLQADIDLAQRMLDAKNHVDALLTADGTNLASGITQENVNSAQTEVTALPNGTLKTDLQAKIDTAQSLLDAKTLADAKDAAKADLDQKATDAKNAIEALPNLTDDEKTAAKNAVDNALTDAKDAVGIATTPAEVVTEKDLGVTKINDEVTKAEALDTLNAAKTAAKAELDQKATDANNAINVLPNLTEDQKTAEKNKVNTDLNGAKTAIDSGTDTTAVNNAKNLGDTNITKDLNDAIALDAANLADAKTAAKAELVAKAEAVKNAIDALTSLSDDEKAAAKAQVDAELTRGSNAIDAATTIAKVTEEKTTSIANMDKILKDAKALDAKNAVGNLFDNTGKIKDTVNQDVINRAKEKVSGLDPGTEKDQLNALIAYAEKQLAERNSEVIKPISNTPATKTFDNINTGDHSNIIFYVIGMLLALIGLGFIVRRKIIKQS